MHLADGAGKDGARVEGKLQHLAGRLPGRRRCRSPRRGLLEPVEGLLRPQVEAAADGGGRGDDPAVEFVRREQLERDARPEDERLTLAIAHVDPAVRGEG
jgi:hypothetical protein